MNSTPSPDVVIIGAGPCGLTLANLLGTLGVRTLLVEQHAVDALQIADRAYVMRRGRIVMSGTGTEMLGRLDEIGDSYLAGGDRSPTPRP